MANEGALWLDDRDAVRSIDAKLRAGGIAEAEAESLRSFARDGYFIIAIDFSLADAESIDRDVDRLWSEKPGNVSFAYDSPAMRFTQADASTQRRPRYRIPDLHSVSQAARNLYLHPVLSRYASLILGEPAVAIQSLYFEYGSQQGLHRDSIVVPTPQFGHLAAAWVALEDIDPASGPLAYVPGSQHLPFFQFRTGKPVYDPTRLTEADVKAAIEFYERERVAANLGVRQFLAKRGQVFLWHSALMHGGASPADERKTRKSFAIHYSTLRTQKTRECAVREVVEGVDGESVFSTAALLEQNGASGFANPLDGAFQYRR